MLQKYCVFNLFSLKKKALRSILREFEHLIVTKPFLLAHYIYAVKHIVLSIPFFCFFFLILLKLLKQLYYVFHSFVLFVIIIVESWYMNVCGATVAKLLYR